MIFWSILAYTSIVSFIGVSVHQKKNKNNIIKNDSKSNIGIFMAIASFMVLIFFVGCRSEYNDTYYYKELFENYITGDLSQIGEIFSNNSKSKYFNILQCIFKRFVSRNYIIWFFALGIFQIGAIIKFYYKYSIDYFLSTYLYITSGSFAWLMGGIRQYTAVCIVLYGFEYLVKRKTLKFMFLVAIASLFHVSALIWIPIYFICTSKPWNLKIFLFAIGIMVIVFSLNTFTSVLDETLEGTNYAGMTEHFQEGNGMSPIRFIVSCVPWVMAFLFRRRIEEEHDICLDICVNLSFISSCIYFVAMFTSGIIVGRLPSYFILVNFVLLPWIINRYFYASSRFLVKTACMILYLMYFYYGVILKGTGVYGSELLGI